MRRRVLTLVYEGFEILDLTGPASVFAAANDIAAREAYAPEPVSLSGGTVRSGAGVTVVTRPVSGVRVTKRDTVFAAGGNLVGLTAALENADLIAWLARQAPRAERFGSVCAGAFLLARAGLLGGRRATTHWVGTDDLASAHPDVDVAPDALYVVDGPAWTSAGVSTGIDMALAMVERDLGTAVMGSVAKRLVLHARRPGHQSQFSAVLDVQIEAAGPFVELVAWIDAHLDGPLRVGDLARRVGMSGRTFHRRFAEAVGATPAGYVRRARLDRARGLLETDLPIKDIAGRVGFQSEAAFRSAFEARFGVPPSHHRRMTLAPVETGIRRSRPAGRRRRRIGLPGGTRRG